MFKHENTAEVGISTTAGQTDLLESYVDVAHRLHAEGLHIFPVDHPNHQICQGKHAKCDGYRGKHPTVSWGTWAISPTPQMIDMEWGKRGGNANIGIATGPSSLVVFDEDRQGELDRWCVTYGVELPETRTTNTGRGTHYYYRYDHTADGRIGNVPKIVEGFALDIRGDGGYVVAEGSKHASGNHYAGNGHPIADLPENVAVVLRAATNKTTSTEAATNHGGTVEAFLNTSGEHRGDPNTTRIPFGGRHSQLIAYAGRLRDKGLDYTEALPVFKQRWLLCEQPTGTVPEAQFHSTPPPHCNYPVTWEEAEAKLNDVYHRYAAGDPTAGKNSYTGNSTEAPPRLWNALELEPATRPRWIATGRLPRAAITLLIGDEGIGKSLAWVWLASYITTGKPCPAFGVPAREPSRVFLVITEDDWSGTVRPRLEVAGADLAMIDVICTEKDGSGAPIFPRDLHLIAQADPAPALIVVDAWLDTVPGKISVKDPQQARQALHPWKEVATATDAAVLLLTHTNRVSSANARDRYGATGELRKKARMSLYAQQDEEGQLIIGPEKMNTAKPLPATIFTIKSVQHFEPSEDHDGTVPELVYVGQSDMTSREHIAANMETPGDTEQDALPWLATFLAGGPRWATDVYDAAKGAGINEKKARAAKGKLSVKATRATNHGRWYWHLPQHTGLPDMASQMPAQMPSPGMWASDRLGSSDGVSGHIPSQMPTDNQQISHIPPLTSQDGLMPNGETRASERECEKPGDSPSIVENPPADSRRVCDCGVPLTTQESRLANKCKSCRDADVARMQANPDGLCGHCGNVLAGERPEQHERGYCSREACLAVWTAELIAKDQPT